MKNIEELLYKVFRKFTFVRNKVAKKQFESCTTIDVDTFINDLNLDVQKERKQPVKSKLKLYSGFNNLFFVNHFIDAKLLFVTKVALTGLVFREACFFEWQKKHVIKSKWVCPNLLFHKKIPKGDLSCLTIEYLVTPKKYIPEAVLNLYHRIGGLSPHLLTLEGVERKGNLWEFEFNANTKITNIISNVVTKLHLPSAYVFAQKFIDERKEAFCCQKEFIEVKMFLSSSEKIIENFDYAKIYGLLHGDFKKSNILSDNQGVLMVIDLQYYNYGARLWDMAFFCSKEKAGFNQSYLRFIKSLELDDNELRVFVFLYILACLLHAKRITNAKILSNKILPSINFMKSQKLKADANL